MPTLLGKQLLFQIEQRNFEMAEVLLRDLAFRHREAFDAFIEEFGDDLPPGILNDLGMP